MRDTPLGFPGASGIFGRDDELSFHIEKAKLKLDSPHTDCGQWQVCSPAEMGRIDSVQ
jgi:hypothetical protein